MPTVPPVNKPNAADLIALALDHRMRAERSTGPAEQCELHRVADIYEALATLDLPLSTLERVYGPSCVNSCQLAEVVA